MGKLASFWTKKEDLVTTLSMDLLVILRYATVMACFLVLKLHVSNHLQSFTLAFCSLSINAEFTKC